MQEAGFPQVVATKLVAPWARSETIPRARVRRLLDATRDHPLTLVCAPAGYGKTFALAEWCETLDAARAWITLGREDNDPQRMCAHVLAALDQLWPAAMWPAQEALQGGSDLPETVVPLVADAIARELGEHGLVVVLDGYERISAAACHDLVTALIDALPAGARIVVASRTRPPLRLARRRAARDVADLGPVELAFDNEETERLLNRSLRLRLAPGQVEAIRARVEGWPAGLSLVASMLRSDPDADPDRVITALPGSHEGIAEYLSEEVLDAVSPRMRDFLLRTSVLGRMNAALCEAVLDDPDAGQLFAEARRSNLFLVTLGDGADDEPWVRYHSLFSGLLRRQLRRREPDVVAGLHRRAALWFLQAARYEDAIDHATSAGDGELAARILHEHAWWPLLVERRYATLRRMIAQMPPDRGELGPFCELIDTLCMSMEGADLRRVAQRLDALEPRRDAPYVAEILDGMRVSAFYGDIPRALAAGWRLWNDDPGSRVRQAGRFATVLWFAQDAGAIHGTIAPYLGRTDRPTLRSWELATLAFCAADDRDLEASERYGREAVAIVRGDGGETALEAIYAYVALAEALRRRGRLDDAYEPITNAQRITAKVPGSLFEAFVLVFRAQVDLSAGNRPVARRHAQTARRIIDRFPDTGVLARRLAIVEAALERPTDRATADSEPTAAERRVLQLLPTDLTRAQIAAKLGVSTETIKVHTRRLYRRLGVHSREEAIEVARERGLV